MHTRETFHSGLSGLKESIVKLGEQVDQAFHHAMDAFVNNDFEKIQNIKENDLKINQQELVVNEKATLLIARQQPVASDLRKIIVAFKISSDLERVGDLAVDICKAAERIPKTEMEIDTTILVEMAIIASGMVTNALRAYESGNVLEAQQIAHLDDQVDDMYARFVKQLFNIVISDQLEIEQVTQLAFISRYIERIADYATNIAELIIYEVNGQYFDLN
ncbi:phosphate transport system regulatory protein PhoU [Anaerobacillus alkalidiazotrophicus]|uniref:Phosphate-specific transport system accessory protein PhoU n=1 Tax=Anaerobacillus alkalidiazotrophicus TaxID=472963 RepID=A0A1S2M5J2_9BACI|nr:phosphate signaling complex protein PhoU [Anaerobacillus alkalidiazotrophicus]OIJ18397.1 phosphate transport system regulatory protein PhoU [Anaerobacillus alkalidiazotrophicus]OIJ19876.1 phosphate transport system regulatory protein PhoU [Anaerobacillus alkalidiazotrophicus]